MDAVRVAQLREVLAGTEWVLSARRFAGSLRGSVTPHRGGLLLVGCESYEPWHLAAHLDDEAAWSGLPELSPTLVRHSVPPSAPAHLSVGLGRIEAAGRGETLLVVAGEAPRAGLLERVQDARKAGATVLALADRAAGGLGELDGIAHDALTADAAEVDLDTVQHLVSAAAGETFPATGGTGTARGPGGTGGIRGFDGLTGIGTDRGPLSSARRRRLRDRLSRLADQLTAPPPGRW